MALSLGVNISCKIFTKSIDLSNKVTYFYKMAGGEVYVFKHVALFSYLSNGNCSMLKLTLITMYSF